MTYWRSSIYSPWRKYVSSLSDETVARVNSHVGWEKYSNNPDGGIG